MKNIIKWLKGIVDKDDKTIRRAKYSIHSYSRSVAVGFMRYGSALTLFRITDILCDIGMWCIMMIEDLLERRKITKYRLAVEANIPHATLSDICSGKTKLENCSAETVYKLAKALGVSMELLTEAAIYRAERERSYEYNLPEYLQHDLDEYKQGLKDGSNLIDCLWGELYGSINAAEISDQLITREHADYLRQKFLRAGTRI